MLLKVLVFFLGISIGLGQHEQPDWEIAVVINDQIELLESNGTLIGSTVDDQFTRLKALTFDNIRHQFVVSDTDQENDTILTVQLTKGTEKAPIIHDLPDDVQGLAIDPIEDFLYWTDTFNRTINYIDLNDSYAEPKILFNFQNTSVRPQDIAIDVCRRMIYWSNSNTDHPTIERAFLNGSHREVLIDSGDLHQPAGIAIDYENKRLYWADRREGIYYRIDSSDLNGGEREIVYSGTDIWPFGIAVDKSSIYWTDINNNALWRYYKSDKSLGGPQRIREFKERPMGIIAKNVQIRTYPDCMELESAYEKYKGDKEEFFNTEFLSNEDKETIVECLNSGQLMKDNKCKCKRGFSGSYCEIDNCHNFCIRGVCHRTSRGYPLCHCDQGFGGDRCELDMCSSFCLNGGSCSYWKGDLVPSCQCPRHYTGSRCEISADFDSVCKLYCQESTGNSDYLVSKDRDLICHCHKESYTISDNNQTTQAMQSTKTSPFYRSFMEKFTSDNDYLTLVLALVLLIVLNISLVAYHFCTRRYKRPIIKKRVIVNKNVTPLTYRPQPNTEQCEITIENCCNMNVCETPCFEPSAFRSSKEDKKVLLSDMDHGEDSY